MITRRTFVSSAAAFGAAFAGSTLLAACGGSSASAPSASSASNAAPSSSASASATAASQAAPAVQSKSAIVFFSRAGENYEVGVVEEGNTAVVAHSMAGKVVSDVYEIQPAEAYPAGYDDCVAQAKSEQNAKARPALVDPIAEVEDYDVIYLGYPIWHSDLPMPVYTFLESHDWSGKKIMPFCTHGDSGLSGTVDQIKRTCPGASVSEGLAIRGSVAQAAGQEMDSAINTWLAKVRS